MSQILRRSVHLCRHGIQTVRSLLVDQSSILLQSFRELLPSIQKNNSISIEERRKDSILELPADHDRFQLGVNAQVCLQNNLHILNPHAICHEIALHGRKTWQECLSLRAEPNTMCSNVDMVAQ